MALKGEEKVIPNGEKGGRVWNPDTSVPKATDPKRAAE